MSKAYGAKDRAGAPAPFTVFLDRDGVFCRLRHPGIRRWDQFQWLAGVKEAFALLNRPGIQTCLVTNQPQVGHLLATPGMVRRVNQRMKMELEDTGGRLDHVEAAFAPVGSGHRRRKPKPGMLEDGAVALGDVDKGRAVMIGDSIRDAGAAAAFGIPAVLLATTHDEAWLLARCERAGVPVEAIVTGLPEAVSWVLRRVAKD